VPAKTKPRVPATWIGAAECAARTGLSARALRIYEQQKLLKPARDPNGWRQYSSADLTRLNTIAVLKALGLSLSQIRVQLNSSSASLEGILRIQMEAWRARKAAAEDAIALVQGAQQHIKRYREIPIDRMCELVRCLEINTHVPDYRSLIAKHITSDDSQAWSEWWIEHPDDLAESRRYLEAQNSLFRELKAAMDAGGDAGSKQVGLLMTRWESIFLTHHVRERAVRQMRWNYDVTLKWYTVGHKNRVAERGAHHKAREDDLYTVEFAAFLDAAYQKSDHGKALNAIHAAAAELIATCTSPSSPRAQRLATRFAKLCSTFSLGDPLIHAQFALFIERVNHGNSEPKKAKSWHFLQRSLEVHYAARSMPRGEPGSLELRTS
jgi:MerR family transcriptional regulator, thiopeptide resistance regulator